MSCGLSRSLSKYSTTRSTAFIFVSNSLAMFVPCSMYQVTSKAYTRVKPAKRGAHVALNHQAWRRRR